MRLSDFDYDLPSHLIAQEPLEERDASRLLVLDRDREAIAHRHFRDLPELLHPADLLVVNRSRVFPARLLGMRSGGGRAEVLLVRPLGENEWIALVRPGRRLRVGNRISIDADFEVEIRDWHPSDGRLRHVRLRSRDDPGVMVARYGHVPLPPYIRRADRPLDHERYQTVFARDDGSVAAPTAGLHFTPELLVSLSMRGIRCAEVVLHVGPGTFLPIEHEDVREHRVMPESYDLPEATCAALHETRRRGGRVIAVGTTTCRVLETAFLLNSSIKPMRGETDLTIMPGHRFGCVDALVTNFHLPRSSLLLLVSAFTGRERILGAYREAIIAGYRFYSYGDAMLIV
jgi:S-adenosylmethionine:tRNA ribosyltransferase-isomerase